MAMSEDEFRRWLIYRSKWGVSQIRAAEYSAALIAQSMRGGEFSDYLPNREDKVEAKPEDAIKRAMFALGGKMVKRQ